MHTTSKQHTVYTLSPLNNLNLQHWAQIKLEHDRTTGNKRVRYFITAIKKSIDGEQKQCNTFVLWHCYALVHSAWDINKLKEPKLEGGG